MGCIYGVIFKKTGEIKYVGQTMDFGKRKYQHIWESMNRETCKSYLHAAIKKHGIEFFEFIILQDGINDRVHLDISEGQWARDLETLSSMGNGGYNIIDPWREFDMIDTETKDKMLDARRAKALDPEWRKKLSLAALKREARKRGGKKKEDMPVKREIVKYKDGSIGERISIKTQEGRAALGKKLSEIAKKRYKDRQALINAD